MDVIYYNRISTDNKDQDPTSNLETTKRFCKYANHKIIATIIDKGVSGSVAWYKRKEAKKINEYIEKYKKLNKPLGIALFSIDRFSREHPVKALFNIHELENKGVKLFSATESIFNEENEFALPMQFNILWFNFYFLVQHSKKVKAGIEKRKAKGLHIGRGLVKKVIKTDKGRVFQFYSDDELDEIHNKIRTYCKKNSYREVRRALRRENINVSLSYISKVMNNG